MTKTETVYIDRPVLVFPDSALTDPVTKPRIQGRTNKDVLNYVNDLVTALKQANSQLEAIAQQRQTHEANGSDKESDKE